jgi:hypothetical protein
VPHLPEKLSKHSEAMRSTLIALTAVLVLAMSAVAEEPTGFAEFPWETLRKGLIPDMR